MKKLRKTKNNSTPQDSRQTPVSARRRPSHSVRFRIVLVSALFSTALALLTAFFSYIYFTRSLRQTQEASTRSNLQVVGAELDLAFERVMSFANWTQIDTSVANYLQHMSNVTGSDFSRQDRQLTLTAWELVNQEYIATGRTNDIQRVVIMTTDGRWYIQCLDGASRPSYINVPDGILGSSWFRTLADSDRYLWQLEKSPFPGKAGEMFFPVVRPIQRTTSSEVVGYCYLEISPDAVTEALSSIHLEEDAALYLTLNTPAGTSADDKTSAPQSGRATYSFRDGTLTPASLPSSGLVSCSLPRTDFLLSMQPSSALYRSQSRHYLVITVLIFAAVFLAGLAMSLILQHLISDPVTALLAKTSRVGSGDFSRDPAIEWNNEFGDIGRGLNDLSENVSALMDKRVQDEKQKQALEYQILQSQINPHFLYNTLNTIKWMATIQGSDGIAEMSTALSRLLRNVSKSTRNLIPLREELSLVQDYFTIMKYRYGGTITLEVNVDDESIYDLLVNRFSLQPIVENAIFHGIEPKGAAGTITIHAFLADTLLQIDVADNGIGMDETACQKALSADTQESTDFFRHVGISNVNQRIKYAFGEQYGLAIHSKPGKYTVVSMMIPARQT